MLKQPHSTWQLQDDAGQVTLQLKQEAVQVKRLAQSALSSGSDNQNRAQSCLILARACHADGQIQEAVGWYSQVNMHSHNACHGSQRDKQLQDESQNAVVCFAPCNMPCILPADCSAWQ